MRTPSLFSPKPLCLAAMLCAAAGAQAGIMVYTSETAFLAAVPAPGTGTFGDPIIAPYGDAVHRTAGAYHYQAYSAISIRGAGGPTDVWLSNNLRYNPMVFSNFRDGASAFGGNFFASDVAGRFVDGAVVLTAADGGTLTYDFYGATSSSFLGFVSTAPLASVTLGTDGGAYRPTASHVVPAVPEPAAYGMMLAGITLLGVAARRRRG
ncbi:PEP-CTERM sorting domain-containing protein [Massilia putida]|uniref:PEP-CTERM sorting domain-containing protein n=1 Tax=Massilia putida TaxID=1141883 RepID=UPI001E596EB2|nr:PEP-CTERM sorting domain-containing protein [Massilia putida]